MSALVRRHLRKAEEPSERTIYELQELTVAEVSLVDRPAIGRDFVVIKSRSAVPTDVQAARDESHARVTAALERSRLAGTQKRQEEARRKAFFVTVAQRVIDLSKTLDVVTKKVAEAEQRQAPAAIVEAPLTRSQLLKLAREAIDQERGWRRPGGWHVHATN